MPSRVFFSSCFTDPPGQRLAIRDRINDQLNDPSPDRRRADPENLPVWMAENWYTLDEASPVPFLEKALICVEGVRTSEAYVAVVRQNYGSVIETEADRKVQASYFELELFEAALLRKPAAIYVLEGAEPDKRLLSLLKLLQPALPGLDWTPRSEDYIFGKLAGLVETAQRRPLTWKMGLKASGVRMSDQLTATRHQPYDPLQAGPKIHFLGGLFDPSKTESPDPDLVESVLARARAEPNHHRRLSLIWMAIRELMAAPPTRANDHFIPLWRDALTAWNAAGAWYGLHGHPLMGCLAALGSLSQIEAERSGYQAGPHGGLASEYYSIAKHVGQPALKQEALRMSRAHVEAAFLNDANSGAFGLRGSIRFAQGDKTGAVADYRHALDLRMNVEESDASGVGEARSELGFALVRLGQREEGIRLMEDGMHLLEQGQVTGFVIRAKRKLGRAYLMDRSPRAALVELASAQRMAAEHDMLDQIDRIDWLAGRIDTTLPALGRPRRRR